MDVKIFWADSRGKVIAVLVLLWVAVLIFQFRTVFVLGVAFAVAVSVALDSLIIWLRTKKRIVSLSTMVTGLLIGLIIDPLNGLFPIGAACLMASISKNFIGKGTQTHIFNPAAFGIVMSSFIFNRPVSWWGVAWGRVPVIIIAIGMLPVLWKLRRNGMPLLFLAVFFVINLIHGTVASATQLTIDGTVFLFAFIMLPEPKTTPIQGAWRWGMLVGVFVFAQNFFGIAAVDPLLVALLISNLYGFFFVRAG